MLRLIKFIILKLSDIGFHSRYHIKILIYELSLQKDIGKIYDMIVILNEIVIKNN